MIVRMNVNAAGYDSVESAPDVEGAAYIKVSKKWLAGGMLFLLGVLVGASSPNRGAVQTAVV